jgi:hypothetical protein
MPHKPRPRKAAARPETFRPLVKTLPPEHTTPVTTILVTAWFSLTRQEQELLLPRLLSRMPGWRSWKTENITLWLEGLFEQANINF